MIYNETEIPENECFNPHPLPDYYLPNGMLDVSTCKFEAPAYVSFPHFYKTDPEIRTRYK